jgi:hypothetical protein
MSKVGILLVATGRYKEFFENFYNTCEKNFLINYEKTYFYFTDSEEDLTKKYKNIVQIKKNKLGFPGDTLYRYKFFHNNREKIINSGVEYLFYLDVDMKIVNIVGEEIFPKGKKHLTGVFHPGFYNQKKRHKPHEKRQKSSFFVPENKRKLYLAGGFQGGITKHYLDIAEKLMKMIDNDEKKYKMIPKVHDESAWNHYFIYNMYRFNIMKPEYCYPEFKSDKEKQRYQTILEMTPRILALSKDHKYYRETK